MAQAANGFIIFDPETGTFSLSPEQVMVFAIKDSPVYLAGAFDLVAAMIEGEAKVEASFRNGSGVRWGDSAGCLFCSVGGLRLFICAVRGQACGLPSHLQHLH